MAFVTADRVSDTSTSTGTGAFVVSGSPAAGYRTFSAVMSVSDTCFYTIQHATLNEWENGIGTYSSANTLTRTTVSSSSNAGSLVTFSAGTKNVSITLLAPKTVQTDPTTAGNVLFTADGSVWSSTAKIVQGTSVASTSGTSITFTGLPSWVKRITVMLNGVSTNGTSPIQIQLGTSGGFVTSGYSSQAGFILSSGSSAGMAAFTTGLYVMQFSVATDTVSSVFTINNLTGNVWTYYGNGIRTGGTPLAYFVGAAPQSLGGVLTQVRLTTVNGTDTFDAGSVNILYE